MFELFLKGGFLMWPIFLCSVMTVCIALERFYVLHRARPRTPNLFARVKNLVKEDKIEEALKLCESSPDPVAHILAIGLHIRQRSLEEKERMLSRTGSRLIRGLEKHLRGLAIIGNTAPLLGLLGTVTGMIKAFIKIQEAGGQADTALLAGGIWEALLTTAAGLSVAIIALVIYHYFEGRVDSLAVQMKDTASEVIELTS